MTEVSERVGGEVVTLAVTIGVLEAVARVEDDMLVALAKLQRGSYALTRATLVAGAKAAGRRGDVEKWADDLLPGRHLALARLAFLALSEALAEGAAAAKKDGAAETTTAEAAS